MYYKNNPRRRTAEIAAIEAYIAAQGVTYCPSAYVVPVAQHLFDPLLIAQKLAAMRLPPTRRPPWMVLWVARLRDERHAYEAGMTLADYRTARAAPVAQG